MNELLNKYTDMMAELLDEQQDLDTVMNRIEELSIDELSIDEIVQYFTEVYKSTPEQYADNVIYDTKWALNNDIVGVHDYCDELEDGMLDSEFDSI